MTSEKVPGTFFDVQDAVESVGGQAGQLIMQALIADEVEHLAGKRYGHDAARGAVRWDREEGYVVFAGRKMPLEHPRVRTSGRRRPSSADRPPDLSPSRSTPGRRCPDGAQNARQTG